MSPAPRASARTPPGAARGLLAAAAAAMATACIIPDSDVMSEDQFPNQGAVRLIEPTPITLRADQDCDEVPGLPGMGCPLVTDTLPTGLVRPDQPLCVCAGSDQSGPALIDIFVEDPDVDGDLNPVDDIYGVFLLDMPPGSSMPGDYVAYTNQVDPEEPARLFRAVAVPTIERDDPHIKAFTIAAQGTWDICNDNDGAKLDPGLHELRFMVTDRPWYRPLLYDAEGKPLQEDGELVFDDPVYGMPDLAVGATYDTATYVVQCYEDGNTPEGISCNCET